MSATPVIHLNFRGQARAALEFYATAFGGQSFARTYGEFGMPAGLPDTDKVVFGQVVAPGGFTVMAYDVPGQDAGPATGSTHRENGTTVTDQSFFIALNAETLAEATGYWAALEAGATVVEPLAASAWSAGFGMLTDRFGVTWLFNVVAGEQA
ncbi:VOC family protein [Agreia sp. Leaf283]|uniref:VOC family protein n=1 Tax=Agreia sp. Leaf283 TaxID=1736321 RepID=UPI0006FCB740|nr:VOC family protein [Agreia sp. Leaf283]KQP56822.1 bleomycin resistance protein [Agreia sp. Leaf283]